MVNIRWRQVFFDIKSNQILLVVGIRCSVYLHSLIPSLYSSLSYIELECKPTHKWVHRKRCMLAGFDVSVACWCVIFERGNIVVFVFLVKTVWCINPVSLHFVLLHFKQINKLFWLRCSSSLPPVVHVLDTSNRTLGSGLFLRDMKRLLSMITDVSHMSVRTETFHTVTYLETILRKKK